MTSRCFRMQASRLPWKTLFPRPRPWQASPILNWWTAYNIPGTVSTGFGTLVTHAVWSPDKSSVELTLTFDRDLVGDEVAVIVCLSSGPVTRVVKATGR